LSMLYEQQHSRRDRAFQFACKLARLRLPGLAITGSSGDVRARADHFIPEIISDIVKARVARKLVAAGGADHLRDMRVDVQSAELIAARGERVEENLFV